MNRFVLFTLAAMTGFMLALITNPLAHAQSFQGSEAIVKELIPVTGVEDRAIDLDIRFKVNSAILSPDAKEQLDALGKALTAPELAGSRIRIVGHTDASGDDAYNKTLSEHRAQAVGTYLAEHHGIDAQRLETMGWGEERLKDPANPRGGVNRRVEIVNLSASEAADLTPAPPVPAPETTADGPVAMPPMPETPESLQAPSTPAAPEMPELPATPNMPRAIPSDPSGASSAAPSGDLEPIGGGEGGMEAIGQ